MNMSESIILNGSPSLSKYMNICKKISFKVNRSESRKTSGSMIARVSECEYWYELSASESVSISLSAESK